MQKNETYHERKERPVIYCNKCGKEISSRGRFISRTRLVHKERISRSSSEGCKDEVFDLCDDCYKRFKEWVSVFVL